MCCRPLPSLPLVREALMPRSCGQQASYEKLEILGDAVLKYQATLHCFKAYPQAHEGLPSFLSLPQAFHIHIAEA